MDTKDTAETTAPSVAPAKPAPAPKPAGEPEPEVPVPSVPLSGLRDDSVDGLGSCLQWSIRTSEFRRTSRQRKGEGEASSGQGVEGAHHGDGYGPPDEAPFEDTPEESALSASDLPAVPSSTTTTLSATHPATSSPPTTLPMAEGPGFTGMPYPAYGVTPAATVPPRATAVSEPVASSSTYRCA